MTFIIDGTNGLTFPNSTTQASAGNVLQVVNATYGTTVSTTSGSASDTGLTASITPKFSTSKILVIVNSAIYCQAGTQSTVNVVRNSTTIYTMLRYGLTDGSTVGAGNYFTASYLDSPATASSTTYKVQFARYGGSGTVYAQIDSDVSTITLMEIAQ